MSREEDDHKPSMDDPLLQSGQRSDGTGNLSGTGKLSFSHQKLIMFHTFSLPTCRRKSSNAEWKSLGRDRSFNSHAPLFKCFLVHFWGIIRRFMYFAVCFSVNHGCVTSVVGLASSVLPKKLAGTQLGTLYIVYSLTALFASAALGKSFMQVYFLQHTEPTGTHPDQSVVHECQNVAFGSFRTFFFEWRHLEQSGHFSSVHLFIALTSPVFFSQILMMKLSSGLSRLLALSLAE